MSDDPRLGTTLADRYRLDDLLGEGGMGKVYGAEHVLMRKRLAVKVLHRELTTVPEVVKRFEREAMAAAHIDHPNVAAATDFGKLPDGSVFLVLEYVQGTLLRDEIAKGPLEVERALHVTRQIAAALAAAHELEIVHRDLKPENVMLVDKGGDPDFVKVLDFGIAKVPIGEVGESRDGQLITKAGMVFGTPEYMAPEQALGQSVDGRADLYALGVMLYEMLAGVRPFSSKSQVGILGQQLSNPVPRFKERAPGIVVPPAVEQFVTRLLEKDSDDRFQAARDVVFTIEDLLGAAAPEHRIFTKMGGSPRSLMGSRPDPDSGPVALPRFASDSDSGRMLRADFEPSEADLPELPSPPNPIGRGGALSGPRSLDPPPEPRLFNKISEFPPLKIASGYIEDRRATLPAPMRRVLERVPALGILTVALLVAGGLLGLIVALIVKATTAGPAPTVVANTARVDTPVASASAGYVAPAPSVETALDRAVAGGVPALEELAKQQPSNAEVLVALARARISAKKYSEAVETLSKALEVDPKLNGSDAVASLLFTTAQSKTASTETFRLLEGPMGSKGADIIYDIAQRKGVRKSVKARSERFLRSKEFDRASSPELNIAVALRNSSSCRQTHGLLLRAKNVGDDRSLTFLEPKKKKTGCGAGEQADCFPCLRFDNLLDEAIAAIEKRR